MNFTLVRGTLGSPITPDLARINGALPFSIPMERIGEIINNHTFRLASDPGNDYHTIPTETKLKKSKKTTPTLSGGGRSPVTQCKTEVSPKVFPKKEEK